MAAEPNYNLTRHDFGPDFIFGAATAAYQVEGAYSVGGKCLSNWDTFTMTQPDKITNGDNGCLAIDHYNRFKEDVLMMKKIGLDAYRFSISWSRILPGGRLKAGVSRDGIRFYNELIDFIISQDIIPFATLFHFEFPDCLQTEYGGFLSPKIIEDFVEFANVCFFEFGDRVKYWITLNEPWSYTNNAYVTGVFPPCHGGNISTPNLHNMSLRFASTQLLSARANVSVGDPSTEPYLVAHNLICAHARAAEVYKSFYQGVQGGKIGMTNMTEFFYPFDKNNPADVAAAKRALDFMWGWFVAPMVTGDYPPVMRQNVGDRLPKFTPEMSALLTKSYDFIGLNYYTSNYAADTPNPQPVTNPTYHTDQDLKYSVIDKDGTLIGQQGGALWEYNAPQGLYDLLVDIKTHCKDPLIYITENGWGTLDPPSKIITDGCDDKERTDYHLQHLAMVKQAIREHKVNVKGYIVWSIFDNFEWTSGFSIRFGMVYVDYKNDLVRYPKCSAIWYMNFLNKKLLRSKRQVEEKEERDGTAKKTRNR